MCICTHQEIYVIQCNQEKLPSVGPFVFFFSFLMVRVERKNEGQGGERAMAKTKFRFY